MSYTSINDAVSKDNWLTPLRIAKAYNIPNNTGKGVKIGIFSQGGGWSSTDFDNSMRDLGLSSLITSSDINTVLIDGATGIFDDSGVSVENTLDLYCVAALAPEAEITIYIGNAPSNPLSSATWAINILSRMISDNCDIITMSYSIDENYGVEDFFGDLILLAISKGILILSSTGDDGVLSGANYDNTPSAAYPASHPKVLAIGGSHLALNNSGDTIAWERAEIVGIPDRPTWGSGGGISINFPVPQWQDQLTYQIDVIENNQENKIPVTLAQGELSSSPHRIGRGVPDMSGPMNGYALWSTTIVNETNISTVQIVGGTSASCPLIAGMFARIIARSSKRLFIDNLHNILYSNPSLFNDITEGNNDTYNALGFPLGYATNIGWDPVTGLGSPKGDALFKLLVNGTVFPKTNVGTRPTSNVTYPRVKTKIQ
jgi:kumamolisin